MQNNHIEIKQQAFEYLLSNFFKWKAFSLQVSEKEVSFTRVEAMKLLFFVSAIKTKSGEDLLDIFDRFYALQYGPVELSVYNTLVQNSLSCFVVEDRTIYLKADPCHSSNIPVLKEKLDASLITLQNTNPLIATYPAHKLVDISHSWICWKSSMDVADLLKKNSFIMDTNSIRASNQYFGV